MSEEVNKLRAEDITHGGIVPYSSPEDAKASLDRHFSTIHYAAIGRVIAAWAYFETIIDYWIHKFADVDTHAGTCLTGQMVGFRPRFDAFTALVFHRGASAKWIKIINSFKTDAQGLSEQRNRMTHDVWDLKDPQQPKRTEVTARGKLRILEKVHPTEDILSLDMNIHDLWWKFETEIAEKLFMEIGASLEKDQ